jgi:hypothetical protein
VQAEYEKTIGLALAGIRAPGRPVSSKTAPGADGSSAHRRAAGYVLAGTPVPWQPARNRRQAPRCPRLIASLQPPIRIAQDALFPFNAEFPTGTGTIPVYRAGDSLPDLTLQRDTAGIFPVCTPHAAVKLGQVFRQIGGNGTFRRIIRLTPVEGNTIAGAARATLQAGVLVQLSLAHNR